MITGVFSEYLCRPITEEGSLLSSSHHPWFFVVETERQLSIKGAGCVLHNCKWLLSLYQQALYPFYVLSLGISSCWKFFYEFCGPKKEPNSTKWWAKKKKLHTMDISIQRNEILNTFIIPSICSYFSLHMAIFPFSPFSYWHRAQGLERNLSFII